MVFSAWKGFDSPLRRQTTPASCFAGDHQMWWLVQADDAGAALAQLPPYVASRTDAVAVRDVLIP